MDHFKGTLCRIAIFLFTVFPVVAFADAEIRVVPAAGGARELTKPAGPLADDVLRFDVTRYQVAGNSIIPAEELDAILAPFTGKGRDFGDVQQAIEALEDAYRSRGFHAVRVLLPEQELQGGAVSLRAVEAKVGKVVIDGNRHYDADNIRGTVPGLMEGSFPLLDRISGQIRIANESPTRKMQMQLEAGDAEDRVNAVIKVADERPWKIGTYLEDTGTKDTGTLRLGFLAQHANLFNRDHLLTLQYVTSPDHADKVNIYSLGYRIPFYAWGDSLDLYAGYSDVDSGSVSSGILNLAVNGKGAFGGFRYNFNLQRHGSYEHKIITGFDYRVFESNVLLTGVQLGGDTESHTMLLGYAGSLSGSLGEVGFWTHISQNIPGGGNGSTSAFRQLRSEAMDDFTIFKAGINAVSLLPADLQARFTATGQYTSAALIPGEQFGIGGQGSVRGFGEREFSDDCGLAGSVELYSPDFMPFKETLKGQLRALTFYDFGYLAHNKAQPGEKTDRTIASTGLGLRMSIGRYLSAATDYAFITEPETGHSRYSGRWHFKVQVAY